VIEILDGKAPKIAESAWIHPSAYIIGDVEIGEKTMIWHGAVVRGDFGAIRIGERVLVEDNCVLHAGSPNDSSMEEPSPLEIGNDTTIGHGAVVHARRIANNVLIGMSACICEDVEIEEYCLIAAGTVVKAGERIPERSFVTGVPGKIKGKVSEKQSVWTKEGYNSVYIDAILSVMRHRQVVE